MLGSGLGFFADACLREAQRIPYKILPEFPRSTVEGHLGQWVAGSIGDTEVLCMQGRFHAYEGYSLKQVTLPIRMMGELGVEILILTNAAGGIRAGFKPGDFMLISDHINLIGGNPLCGPNDDTLGLRFPDMTEAYDPELRSTAKRLAREKDITLHEGVYVAVSGPSFETPAEIRAFRTLGADAVGMSTVPECIVARHSGLRVCGVSCITNYAAGLGESTLTHGDVAETAARVRTSFSGLVEALIRAV